MLFNKKSYTLEELADHIPSIGKAIASAHQAGIEARQKLADELSTLKKSLDDGLPPFLAQEEKARAAYEATQEALKRASQHWITTAASRRSFVNSYEMKIAAIEKQLIESYDPRIDDARRFFRAALDASRHDDRIQTITEIIGYRPDGKEVCKAQSNRAAVLGKHAYLRGCITAMEAMRLDPDYDELAIESMKAGIPAINVFADC
jgi:DNA repair exonuclease SbcCD ATPase subunit